MEIVVSPRADIVVAKFLDTPGISPPHGNYQAVMRFEKTPAGTWPGAGPGDPIYDAHSYRWTIGFEEGPGSWYLAQFIDDRPRVLYLDYGQDWKVVNFDDVLEEAFANL